jgi:hypothetical protein
LQHLAADDYADQLAALSRDIDSVQLLAGAYGDAARRGWRTGRKLRVRLSITTQRL